MSFNEVWFHRLKYMLTPQLDLYQHIRKVLQVRRGEKVLRILDYGCGNGVGTIQLHRMAWDLSGFDKDPLAVDFANCAFGHLCHFRDADYSQNAPLSIRSDWIKFDVVVCVEVIEHVEDALVLLSNLRSIVQDDGFVFISTLNHNSQYRKNAGHVGKWKVADFRETLNRVFPGVRITDYTLESELSDDSTITPMVAVWEG